MSVSIANLLLVGTSTSSRGLELGVEFGEMTQMFMLALGLLIGVWWSDGQVEITNQGDVFFVALNTCCCLAFLYLSRLHLRVPHFIPSHVVLSFKSFSVPCGESPVWVFSQRGWERRQARSEAKRIRFFCSKRCEIYSFLVDAGTFSAVYGTPVESFSCSILLTLILLPIHSLNSIFYISTKFMSTSQSVCDAIIGTSNGIQPLAFNYNEGLTTTCHWQLVIDNLYPTIWSCHMQCQIRLLLAEHLMFILTFTVWSEFNFCNQCSL